MKPDWKDAPDWANWLAMDETGEWAWFADRPESVDAPEPGYTGLWAARPGTEVECAFIKGWKNTLEQRP